MASEQGAGEEAPVPATQDAQPRKMSVRRRRKLLIAVIVVVVALVVIIWGWSSTGGSFVDVSTIVDASTTAVPAKYLGKIDVRGVVSDWSGSSDLEFKLVDGADSSKSIAITLTGSFPEGFEVGKTVVATGSLDDSLPLHMNATGITVGCSSKY